jgi:hypothetical protein
VTLSKHLMICCRLFEALCPTYPERDIFPEATTFKL